jgi:hypothetical protein
MMMTCHHPEPPFTPCRLQRLTLALLRNHETSRKAGRPWPRRGWKHLALFSLDLLATWHTRMTALLRGSKKEVRP